MHSYIVKLSQSRKKKIPMKSERVVSSRQERLQASEVLWVLATLMTALSDESYRHVLLNKSYNVKYRKLTVLHSKKLKNYMPTKRERWNFCELRKQIHRKTVGKEAS